jgi:hypothetical protein
LPAEPVIPIAIMSDEALTLVAHLVKNFNVFFTLILFFIFFP